jgi:glycosyltransferase involved in cell wall biosynthesis
VARALLTIDEPLWREDGRLAGLQIRVHELACALGRTGHTVTVAAPAGAAPPPGTPYRVVPLAAAASEPADAWITHPRLVARLRPVLAHLPLVVDGYESPFGSFLAHAAALLPTLGERVLLDYRATVAELVEALVHADRVLCATESQRIAYLTLLAALGRLGPRDPSPEVVLTVCSGAPPLATDAATPASVAGDGDPTLLWYGGCYPWFDVDTFLAALPRVLAAVPSVRFVLAGLGGIDEGCDGVPLLPNAARVRAAIAADPTLAARTRVVGWQPYAVRQGLYREAHLGVCTYADGLETQFAMRTRVLDMVWGGLPLVVTTGDEVAQRITAAGAALAVPGGNPDALAAALVALLTDPARRSSMAAAARTLAAGPLAWDVQVRPLAAYLTAVAGGTVARRPAPSAADAIVRPNAGWMRRAADTWRRAALRVQGART